MRSETDWTNLSCDRGHIGSPVVPRSVLGGNENDVPSTFLMISRSKKSHTRYLPAS